jgi:hypothetical protein
MTLQVRCAYTYPCVNSALSLLRQRQFMLASIAVIKSLQVSLRDVIIILYTLWFHFSTIIYYLWSCTSYPLQLVHCVSTTRTVPLRWFVKPAIPMMPIWPVLISLVNPGSLGGSYGLQTTVHLMSFTIRYGMYNATELLYHIIPIVLTLALLKL